MKNITKKILLMIGIVMLGLQLSCLEKKSKPNAVLEKAPLFTGVDCHGNTQSLSNYIGKTIVLEWKNSKCPFVKKHYESNNMQTLQKEATEDGVIWLSIISSAKGKQGHQTPDQCVERIQSEGSYATAVILDENGEIGKLYNAKVTPHMYVINPDGMIVYQGAIDSIASVKKSDIPKANNYIRDSLEKVKKGKSINESNTTAYGCSIKY